MYELRKMCLLIDLVTIPTHTLGRNGSKFFKNYIDHLSQPSGPFSEAGEMELVRT